MYEVARWRPSTTRPSGPCARPCAAALTVARVTSVTGAPSAFSTTPPQARLVVDERHERGELDGDGRGLQHRAERPDPDARDVGDEAGQGAPCRLAVAGVIGSLEPEPLTVRAVCLLDLLDHLDEVVGVDGVAVEGHHDATHDRVHLRPVDPLDAPERLFEVPRNRFGPGTRRGAHLDVRLAVADPRAPVPPTGPGPPQGQHPSHGWDQPERGQGPTMPAGSTDANPELMRDGDFLRHRESAQPPPASASMASCTLEKRWSGGIRCNSPLCFRSWCTRCDERAMAVVTPRAWRSSASCWKARAPV